MSTGASQETKTITLSHLIRDPKFQVRRRLHQPAINRYIDVLKTGNAMPPIQIVYMNGAPVLIDGWHRVEAMGQLGRVEVEATVLEATEKEAYWLAAKANMEHGVSYKKSELREVFRAYVEAGQHKKSKNRFKSYREMQSDLSIPVNGGSKVDHGAAQNWASGGRADHIAGACHGALAPWANCHRVDFRTMFAVCAIGYEQDGSSRRSSRGC
ncbi:ParB N-terminal domain-containing protein [Microvirga ossetica]|uniref:ParB N-terminal domain-containing protein n=1 Tax=Microvirga ossetica TaxID=1882682 RepID=UPI0012FFEF72|nr:ParB N-terminal domain-containing protein [Microvirga ossetica]